jgi:hypothetical protein
MHVFVTTGCMDLQAAAVSAAAQHTVYGAVHAPQAVGQLGLLLQRYYLEQLLCK